MKLAKLAADDWHNQSSQPFNDNIDTNNKLASINLAEFGLFGKISLTDVIKEVCKKGLIDNYLINNKIDVIISMITSSRAAIANHFQESNVICPCQVSEVG